MFPTPDALLTPMLPEAAARTLPVNVAALFTAATGPLVVDVCDTLAPCVVVSAMAGTIAPAVSATMPTAEMRLWFVMLYPH